MEQEPEPVAQRGNVPEKVVLSLLAAAFLISISALVIGVHASYETSQEANRRSAAIAAEQVQIEAQQAQLKAAQIHQQVTFCGFFQYVGSIQLPPSVTDLGKGISSGANSVVSPQGLDCPPTTKP